MERKDSRVLYTGDGRSGPAIGISSPRRNYLRSGFVLALTLRLLTSSLAIVIPLFAIGMLGATTAGAGVFVLLLWIGNGVGVLTAVFLVRNQSISSVAGFVLVAVSMAALWQGVGGSWSSLVVLTSGAGLGLPQPFLSALMHIDSGPENPFSGIGLYSTALGIGLVLGPLVAYGVLPFYGFAGVFLALSLLCALGVAGAAIGRGALAAHASPPRPSISGWTGVFRGSRFRRAIAVNFLYSLLLPLFLSYGAIYAEGRFGFTSASALLLFTVVFTMSLASRMLAVRFRPRLDRLLLASVLLLFASSLCLGLAPSWPVFVVGMLIFSLPHAFVFPIANYFALASSEGDGVLHASYAFQASSGVAEFLAPAGAVLLVPGVGVQGLFLAGAVLAAGALMIVAKTRPEP